MTVYEMHAVEEFKKIKVFPVRSKTYLSDAILQCYKDQGRSDLQMTDTHQMTLGRFVAGSKVGCSIVVGSTVVGSTVTTNGSMVHGSMVHGSNSCRGYRNDYNDYGKSLVFRDNNLYNNCCRNKVYHNNGYHNNGCHNKDDNNNRRDLTSWSF